MLIYRLGRGEKIRVRTASFLPVLLLHDREETSLPADDTTTLRLGMFKGRDLSSKLCHLM